MAPSLGEPNPFERFAEWGGYPWFLCLDHSVAADTAKWRDHTTHTLGNW